MFVTCKIAHKSIEDISQTPTILAMGRDAAMDWYEHRARGRMTGIIAPS